MLNLLVYIVLYIVFEKHASFNKPREKNLCQKTKIESTRYNALIEMYP